MWALATRAHPPPSLSLPASSPLPLLRSKGWCAQRGGLELERGSWKGVKGGGNRSTHNSHSCINCASETIKDQSSWQTVLTRMEATGEMQLYCSMRSGHQGWWTFIMRFSSGYLVFLNKYSVLVLRHVSVTFINSKTKILNWNAITPTPE